MSQATPTSPPMLQGRYRIEEKLGTGRLAVVYRAFDDRLQRPVLVHLFRKELMAQEPLRQRFLAEAQHSARRSHPSLLDVFDSGELAGRPYLITEFVGGRAIRELGVIALEDALLYFRQVVGAVAACQAAGVPHPPISSANLILVDDGHVELLESWTTPAAEVGLDIAGYRPPERTAGSPVTPAGAVYSLGLLLVEMLSGRRVITGVDPSAIAQAHLTTEIPPLSQISPQLYAPSLERLVRRATARDPARRPQDAAALGRALDDLRRTITRDTAPLETPVARPPARRRRDTDAPAPAPAPVPLPRPVPAPVNVVSPAPPVSPPRPVGRRADTFRQRSIVGLVVMLALFGTVAWGTFSLSQGLADGLALPSISLPGWLTGVVSGGGEVLIVSISGPEGLNLRENPGLNARVIGLLPDGTRVRKLGGPEIRDNVGWLRVRAPLNGREVEGWVSATYVRPE